MGSGSDGNLRTIPPYEWKYLICPKGESEWGDEFDAGSGTDDAGRFGPLLCGRV
jgi:hypothetical protein